MRGVAEFCRRLYNDDKNSEKSPDEKSRTFCRRVEHVAKIAYRRRRAKRHARKNGDGDKNRHENMTKFVHVYRYFLLDFSKNCDAKKHTKAGSKTNPIEIIKATEATHAKKRRKHRWREKVWKNMKLNFNKIGNFRKSRSRFLTLKMNYSSLSATRRAKLRETALSRTGAGIA